MMIIVHRWEENVAAHIKIDREKFTTRCVVRFQSIYQMARMARTISHTHHAKSEFIVWKSKCWRYALCASYTTRIAALMQHFYHCATIEDCLRCAPAAMVANALLLWNNIVINVAAIGLAFALNCTNAFGEVNRGCGVTWFQSNKIIKYLFVWMDVGIAIQIQWTEIVKPLHLAPSTCSNDQLHILTIHRIEFWRCHLSILSTVFELYHTSPIDMSMVRWTIELHHHQSIMRKNKNLEINGMSQQKKIIIEHRSPFKITH